MLQAYRQAAAEHARQKSALFSPDKKANAGALNRSADKLRRIATEFGRGGIESIRVFGGLLDDSDPHVRFWAAFHVLEVMSSPVDLVDRAFSVLEERAQGEDVDALGTRMRLKQLRAQYGR